MHFGYLLVKFSLLRAILPGFSETSRHLYFDSLTDSEFPHYIQGFSAGKEFMRTQPRLGSGISP
jgi:hypothetical protein